MNIWRGWRLWKRTREIEIELQSFAIGMNSTVDSDKNLHILMLDFDIEDKEKVRESIQEIQEFWNLADAYVYTTKNGMHVLFYEDIMPYERCKMIIAYAKYVDPLFKYISKYHNHKTLRVAGKHGMQQDIELYSVWPGKRTPTEEEREVGMLKRREHQELLKVNITISKEKKLS